MTRSQDFLFTTEYIQNVLYFGIIRKGKVLQSSKSLFYFNTDEELVYDNYFSDFGPLNIGCVYKFCKMLNEKLRQCVNFTQKVVYYTSNDPKKKANAAFLIGCYGVLYLNRSPKDALKPLTIRGQCYKPFQDATPGDSPYTISLLDCLQAIKKAKDLSFINFKDFDLEDYEKYDRIEGGDLNWIIPGKFLAFIGPVDSSLSLYHPPEMYLEYFMHHNVKIVIRLNKRLYDAKVFVNRGIMHYDLFFPDGTCPPRHILMKFFHISEESDDAIGVHCKAGLGRTGSLIGCYLIKHYKMSAHEAIGWMRICRPGSVIGQQQGWLEKMETWLLRQGDLYRRRHSQDPSKLPIHKFGIYSLSDRLAKRRMFTMSRSPTPPCFITSRNVPTPARSRSPSPILKHNIVYTRERTNADNSKPIPRDPSDWRMIITSRTPKSGEVSEVHKRSPKFIISGAGEPKTSRSGTKYSTNTGWRNITNKRSDTSQVNSWQECPMATFRASQVPMLKTVNDAKQFLINNNSYIRKVKEREKNMRSSMNAMPPYPAVEKNSDASQTSRNFQYKRRLGRSPSPPSRGTFERTRATNTPPELDMSFFNSPASLQDALSRLKLNPPRDSSTGAASLGARREAPAGKLAPSVRSDERSTATQGDVLNSIKLQRKLRNSLKLERSDQKKTREKSNGDSSRLELLEAVNRVYHPGLATSSKPRRTGNNSSSPK